MVKLPENGSLWGRGKKRYQQKTEKRGVVLTCHHDDDQLKKKENRIIWTPKNPEEKKKEKKKDMAVQIWLKKSNGSSRTKGKKKRHYRAIKGRARIQR